MPGLEIKSPFAMAGPPARTQGVGRDWGRQRGKAFVVTDIKHTCGQPVHQTRKVFSKEAVYLRGEHILLPFRVVWDFVFMYFIFYCFNSNRHHIFTVPFKLIEKKGQIWSLAPRPARGGIMSLHFHGRRLSPFLL